MARKERNADRRAREDRRRREREAAKRRSAQISALSVVVIAIAVGYLLTRVIMDHI
jgi:hypothetical protein